MNDILRHWEDPQALEVCWNMPQWTMQSQDAIRFTTKYGPKDDLEQIETLARYNLATFDEFRPFCNDPQTKIQMLEQFAGPPGEPGGQRSR